MQSIVAFSIADSIADGEIDTTDGSLAASASFACRSHLSRHLSVQHAGTRQDVPRLACISDATPPILGLGVSGTGTLPDQFCPDVC